MSKPTAGPWGIEQEDMQLYDRTTGVPFTNIYHPEQWGATLTDGVHQVTGEKLFMVIGRTEGSNNKANARLMAAAPELLEALKVSRGQWIHSVNAERCLAAIEKAEGKS